MSALAELVKRLEDPQHGVPLREYDLGGALRQIHAVLREVAGMKWVSGDRRTIGLGRTEGQLMVRGLARPRRGGGGGPGRFGFELVARTVVDAGAGPAHFLVWPSVVDANFHEAGAEKVPEVGGVPLTGYPTLTATTTKRGVYAKVELTYNADYEVRLVGDWDVEQHVSKPAETTLTINHAGEVTNGVYYRRIGTGQMVGGALVLEQDRIGPWSAAWCPGSNWLEVRSPAWALTSMADGGGEA